MYRYEKTPWEYLKETGDIETVWNAYLDDLRYVLDDVETLLNNVDAERVVISADHGDAFGEYGMYGHNTGSLHPKVRYVPWITTTAENKDTYQPRDWETSSDISAEERLKQLGYI